MYHSVQLCPTHRATCIIGPRPDNVLTSYFHKFLRTPGIPRARDKRLGLPEEPNGDR